MTDHGCERPTDPTEADPQEWTCPACRMVWEKRIEATDDFYESWYQPKPGPCPSCEHCAQEGRADCGKADHPRCPTCAHCAYRHGDQGPVWEALLDGMLAQVLAVEPVTYPQGVVGFEATMAGPACYRLTMTLADGTTVSRERSLTP